MKQPIETERLILREFEPEDYQAVYEFGSSELVQRYTGNACMESLDEAKDLIKNVFQNDYATHGYGRYATIYKPDGKLIGFSGLKYLPEFDKTDLGFRYLPEYWGKGIATEASLALLDFGFHQLKLKEIIAAVMPDNVASSRVLEKVGLKYYKTEDYDGDGIECYWYKIENPHLT
jgi:RimJ/RimL family protein N-acetyltransferase